MYFIYRALIDNNSKMKPGSVDPLWAPVGVCLLEAGSTEEELKAEGSAWTCCCKMGSVLKENCIKKNIYAFKCAKQDTGDMTFCPTSENTCIHYTYPCFKQ